MPLALLVRHLAGGPFCCYFFGWEDYMPELQEIGLDPAVQGVPVKTKLSVFTFKRMISFSYMYLCYVSFDGSNRKQMDC